VQVHTPFASPFAFERLRAKVAILPPLSFASPFASLAFERLRAKVASFAFALRQPKAKVLQAKAKVAFERLRAKVAILPLLALVKSKGA
jgi:hypothetical protein